MFQKAIIIGCPGAGKSTFARILSDKTHLPLFYLDMLWHKPDRTTVDRNIFDEKLKKSFQRKNGLLMEITEEHLKCVFNRVKLYFYWIFR